MKDPANMQALTSLHPELMGLIFYERSPRYFNGKLPELTPRPKLTGVFVTAGIEEVMEKVERYDLDFIQLHGEETPQYCDHLKATLDKGNYACTVIKAFPIATANDLELPEKYTGKVDLFLFDSKGKYRGGNGTAFNWEVLQAYTLNVPFLLSGGIGPEDSEKIAEFLATPNAKNCIGIDINSKFEISTGLKDIEQIRTFKEQLLPHWRDSKK